MDQVSACFISGFKIACDNSDIYESISIPLVPNFMERPREAALKEKLIERKSCKKMIRESGSTTEIRVVNEVVETYTTYNVLYKMENVI